jgi:hypothetical protein
VIKAYGNLFDPLRPDRPVAPTPAPASGAPSPVAPVPAAPAVRRDSVQLSDSGRALASRLEADDRATLDPERLVELRRRVYEGAYNSLDVVDQVARRILARGDL